MARIKQLPVELLRAIFLCLRRLPPTYEREPSCKSVSQVCTHWRSIALGTPELWTLIPLKSARWTKLCIARSSPAPIIIHAEYLHNADYETRQRTLSLVYPKLHRISTLRISTSAHGDLHMYAVLRKIFKGLNTAPASRLVDLNISLDDEELKGTVFSRNHSFYSFDPPISLPLAMFDNARLEALETASFKACMLPLLWSKAFIPSSLTSLTFVDAAAWTDVNEMIEFLQLVPSLAFLDFQQPTTWRICPFDTTPSDLHPLRCVQLPHLRNLRIKSPFWQGLAFLIYLSLPETTSIDLQVCDEDVRTVWASRNTEPLLQMGAAAVQDHFAAMTAKGHIYTHVGFGENCIIGPCPAKLKETLLVSTVTREAPDVFCPSVHLSFGQGLNNTQCQRDSYALYLMQPVFMGAENMYFSTFPASEAWPLFHHFATVRDLYLCEKSFFDFADAIVEVPAQSRMFPALRRIQVADASIDFFGDQEEEEWEIEENRDRALRTLRLVQELAQYEHLEMLILVGYTATSVTEETLHAIIDILGDERVVLRGREHASWDQSLS